MWPLTDLFLQLALALLQLRNPIRALSQHGLLLLQTHLQLKVLLTGALANRSGAVELLLQEGHLRNKKEHVWERGLAVWLQYVFSSTLTRFLQRVWSHTWSFFFCSSVSYLFFISSMCSRWEFSSSLQADRSDCSWLIWRGNIQDVTSVTLAEDGILAVVATLGFMSCAWISVVRCTGVFWPILFYNIASVNWALPTLISAQLPLQHFSQAEVLNLYNICFIWSVLLYISYYV